VSAEGLWGEAGRIVFFWGKKGRCFFFKKERVLGAGKRFGGRSNKVGIG